MSSDSCMRETSEYREWSLMGRGRPSMWLSSSHVRLVVGDSCGHVEIDLWAPFRMSADGEVYDVDIFDKDSLAPLVKLLGREPVSLVAYRSGRLIVRFEGDCELRMSEKDQEEPDLWETSGDGDLEGIGMLASQGYTFTPWGEPLDYDHTKAPQPVPVEKVGDVAILAPPQATSLSARHLDSLENQAKKLMIEGEKKILLDLRSFFLNSAGLITLVRLELEAAKREVSFSVCSLHTVPELLGQDVQCFDSREAALAALTTQQD